MDAMASAGSVAVILPTTAYILRLKHPPVRQMIDRGVIVALGTDFNPNAFCLSMVMRYEYLKLFTKNIDWVSIFEIHRVHPIQDKALDIRWPVLQASTMRIAEL